MNSRFPNAARSAFTLIELLVVVAIITILISILLPSLSVARRNAQSVTCMSNLRQLMLLQTLYAEDNSGVVVTVLNNVRSQIAPSRTWSWYSDILYNNKYIPQGKNTILRCPSTAYKPAFVDLTNSVYGVFRFKYEFQWVAGREEELTTEFGYCFVRNTPDNAEYIKLNKCQNPARLLYHADTAYAQGNIYYDMYPGRTSENFCWRGGGDGFGVHLIHNGRANAGFLDGHTESQSLQDLYAPLYKFKTVVGENYLRIDKTW